jgi:hypothetical protein
MVDSINVGGLTVAGRIDAPDPKNGQVAIQKNLDMSNAASFSIDFNSVNQQQTIGVIRTLFCDNTANPSEIVVQALGTGQRFTIPAYSEGYFPIVSRLNAGIVLSTDGGATAVVGVTFFNYDITPVVWYKYGASNKDVAQRVQGGVAAGTVVGGTGTDGVLISGVNGAGVVRRVAVNDLGQVGVDFTNITIGNVKEANGDNVALGNTNDVASSGSGVPATLIALSKYIGSQTGGTLSQITTAVTRLTSILSFTQGGTNAAYTSVPSSTGNLVILATNASRKGATILNDSSTVLRLSMGTASPISEYTAIVYPGDSYIIGASDFSGTIRGTWVTADANGSARVSEIS